MLTGVRWQESSRRAKRRMVESCKMGGDKHYLHPIIDWSEEEVWEYIRLRNLPYCSLYDEGFKRLGCILCPMTRKAKYEEQRWPKVVASYRLACKKGFEVLKERKRRNNRPVGFQDSDEWFEWWTYQRDGKPDDGDPDQTVMFE